MGCLAQLVSGRGARWLVMFSRWNITSRRGVLFGARRSIVKEHLETPAEIGSRDATSSLPTTNACHRSLEQFGKLGLGIMTLFSSLFNVVVPLCVHRAQFLQNETRMRTPLLMHLICSIRG